MTETKNPGIELARELTRARLSDLDLALRKDQERRQAERASEARPDHYGNVSHTRET